MNAPHDGEGATPHAPRLPEGPIEGRHAFANALHASLAVAARENWREIVLCDPLFVDWPLGERAIVDALQAWASAGRSLVMLARNFDVFQREHARFVHWRRMWGHIIDCRACDGPGLPEVPSGIWTPSWHLHRIDIEHSRGVCGTSPEGRRRLRERIDECVRHSKAGFASTTLGL